MADVIIKQVKSTIGTKPQHRATLKTLGLGRIGKEVTRTESESLAGQLRLVNHLVTVTKK